MLRLSASAAPRALRCSVPRSSGLSSRPASASAPIRSIALRSSLTPRPTLAPSSPSYVMSRTGGPLFVYASPVASPSVNRVFCVVQSRPLGMPPVTITMMHRYATAAKHAPAARVDGGSFLGSVMKVFAVLVLLFAVIVASLWYGHNPLFSPSMRLAMALNNCFNKVKVSASHVEGSLRDGDFLFTDFAFDKKSRKKDVSAKVKKLKVKLRTPLMAILEKTPKVALQEGITISDYAAEGIEAVIEQRVKNPKPDPVITFEKMSVKDAVISVIDAEKNSLNKEIPKIHFPPIKITEMSGVDIVTGKAQRLFSRLILAAKWKGAIGDENFEISPAGMDIKGMPVGVLSATLQPPLRWMSDARLDLTTRHERLSDGSIVFGCRVNLRNLTADIPDRAKLSNADATYLPFVEWVNTQTKDRQFPLTFEMKLNESEVEIKAFERQITAGLVRAMSEKAVQHVASFVRQVSQVAQKIKDAK